jgi:hypothetical protein
MFPKTDAHARASSSSVFFFFFFFFFFYRVSVVQPLKAYCISPALKVPTCTARCPHSYNDARKL